MSERYPGGIISKTGVTPSGPYETSTASGVWTLDQQAYWRKLNQWPIAGSPAPDPQFNYVTMLLHGDGTNGAQNNTFLDSSTNNFSITRNGNTTQGSFSPYGSNWSNFFLNTGNSNRITWDFNSSPAQTALAGTNSTIEFWVFRLPKSGTYQCMFSTAGDRNNFILLDSTTLQVTSNGGTEMFLINPDTYIPLNTWTHVALTCSGTTWTLYFNGTSYGTYSGASKSNNSGSAQLGGRNDMNGCGYLSNFRISTTARYSGNFTPSTTPFVSDGSTAMLTCQSNRFIDTSSNAQALTASGSVSVQRFNPFGTSTAYSTSVIGGSGYFDGSGDYLQTPSNTAFSFGTGDFTMECWIYPTSTSGLKPIFDTKFASDNNGFTLLMGNGDYQFYLGYPGFALQGLSATARGGAWNYVVLQRTAGRFQFFLNGVRTSNTVLTINNTDTVLRVGAMYDYYGSEFYYYPGYISNCRVVKGTSVYGQDVTTISVPTAPLTSVSGTSLILNYTNGAIFDNAMMNDLETVGNAQISTSVVKYGTGSLYFDGTDDRLVQSSSPQIAFSTGDFTIEAWIYSLDVSDSTQRGWLQTSSTAGGLATSFTDGVTFVFGTPNGTGCINVIVGGTNYSSSGGAVSTSTWTHIAVTRASGAVKLFVNGTSVASGTGNTTNLSGQFICVGGYYSTSYLYNGYIDDLRITKGYARYTANFTPPTAAFSNTGPN